MRILLPWSRGRDFGKPGARGRFCVDISKPRTAPRSCRRVARSCAILLDAFVLEKAIYELGYELDNRPNWAFIPIYGIAQIAGIARATQRSKN